MLVEWREPEAAGLAQVFPARGDSQAVTPMTPDDQILQDGAEERSLREADGRRIQEWAEGQRVLV